MARRKRASMREGPLADLFRSTDDPSQEPPEFEPRTADDTGGPQGDPVDERPSGQAAGTPSADQVDSDASARADALSEPGSPDPDAAGRFGRRDPLADRREEPAPAPRSEDPGPDRKSVV